MDSKHYVFFFIFIEKSYESADAFEQHFNSLRNLTEYNKLYTTIKP